jgi:hypothetical protein
MGLSPGFWQGNVEAPPFGTKVKIKLPTELGSSNQLGDSA